MDKKLPENIPAAAERKRRSVHYAKDVRLSVNGKPISSDAVTGKLPATESEQFADALATIITRGDKFHGGTPEDEIDDELPLGIWGQKVVSLSLEERKEFYEHLHRGRHFLYADTAQNINESFRAHAGPFESSARSEPAEPTSLFGYLIIGLRKIASGCRTLGRRLSTLYRRIKYRNVDYGPQGGPPPPYHPNCRNRIDYGDDGRDDGNNRPLADTGSLRLSVTRQDRDVKIDSVTGEIAGDEGDE